jgi:hypothetical protein
MTTKKIFSVIIFFTGLTILALGTLIMSVYLIGVCNNPVGGTFFSTAGIFALSQIAVYAWRKIE